MNKARRDRISGLMEQLKSLQNEIEEVATEERAAFDNLPENLKQAESGQKSEDAADAMDEAVSNIEEAYDSLELAIGE